MNINENKKPLLLLLGAFVLSAITVLTAFTPIHEGLHQAMTKMMQKMNSMKMTGNPDHDFAMMMAEHHQGSIDMSQIIVKEGKDEKIKMLAQSILDKQPQEQKQLRSHSSKNSDNQHSAHNQGSGSSASKESSEFASEMKQAMSSMESDMNSMKMTNNIDHDFASMMIPHHQSAIEMSDAIIKNGKDEEIKQMAQKIRSDSQKEIGELKDWLQNHGK
jgi:uncharacterized protein (DUF305 family)